MVDGGGKNGRYIEPWDRWGIESQAVLDGLQKRGTGGRLWDLSERLVKDYM